VYQISFQDIERINKLQIQPGRSAFVDECGNFGFDFSETGTSAYYVLCAVIVRNDQIQAIENDVSIISTKNFGIGEMKSSTIGKNHKRRLKICTELLMLDFSLILLIADKKAFMEDSPLKDYKSSFVKFLHQKLYELMYSTYPKLKIVEDEYGSSEFQQGYRKYIIDNRPDSNLFDEYDFDYVNSIDSPLVRAADIIAGSIMQHLLDNEAPDILKIFQGKIRGAINFPTIYPQFSAQSLNDTEFDNNIYQLADRCATNYISSHNNAQSDDERLNVLFLRHLLFYVRNINTSKYVSSVEIVRVLSELSDHNVSRDHLYRRIIAPLRDAGVIIASCSQGYKIPTCINDIISYINQTNGVVGPMLNRIGKCRKLILQQTDGNLDIFDDQALLKYKRYFGDI
jgi:hypothetical protein